MSYFYPADLVRTASARSAKPCLAIEEHTFTFEHVGTKITGYTFMIYFGPANADSLTMLYKLVSLLERSLPEPHMVLAEDTDRAGDMFPKLVCTCSTITTHGQRAGREFISACIRAGVCVSYVELDAVVRALEPQAES